MSTAGWWITKWCSIDEAGESLEVNAAKFARSSVGKWCVGWMMEHWSGLLPVDRLYETDCLLAFRHPQPGYQTHILIVPKKAIADLPSLSAQGDIFVNQFMIDLLSCVTRLVADYSLENQGYRLIANGGAYQDIPELHFHLISGGVLA
jgi:histidine triad (HIT) family protein